MTTTRTQVEDALDTAWGSFVADTGCIPDAFKIHGPRTTRVSFDATLGNFAQMVTDALNATPRGDTP